MKSLIDSRPALWVLLSIPAAILLYGYLTDSIGYGAFIQRSGDWSARLLILTMSVTALRLMFPGALFPLWLMERRRDLGLATFAYAFLHTIVYLVRKADMTLIVSEGLERNCGRDGSPFSPLPCLR